MNTEKIKEMVKVKIAYDNFISKEKQMKNRFHLISSIIMLVIGLLAITSYIILLINKENMMPWLVALILSIILVIMGIVGIIDYKRKN